MAITLLDGILLVIMLISALLAMIRGFSREVLSIVSWVIAAAAALYLYKMLSPTVMNLVGDIINKSQIVADIISAASIFLVVLIIVSYLTMLLADYIVDSRIGVLDRTLGFIFGAARGGLLVVVALMGFLGLANDNVPKWVEEAKSKPMLVSIGTGIVDALPENLLQSITNAIGNQGDEKKEGESEGEQKT